MKILFISDTHITDKHTICNENLDTIKKYIEENPVDITVHLGDIAADGATYPSQLTFAAASFNDFGSPIHFVPGNHDVGDNPIAPGRVNDAPFHLDDARLTLERLDAYRRVFGPDYWSLDLEGWQLVGLNAQLFATDTEAETEQFSWLEDVLRKGKGSLGVVLHKPFFRNGHEDDEAHIRYVPAVLRRRLVDLLTRRDLKFVLSGHVHQDRRIVVDGVEHVWVPSASFCMPDAMQERIGAKVAGVLTADLMSDGTHRFEKPVIDGLVTHNVVYHPEIDPRMTELRIKLGKDAEL